MSTLAQSNDPILESTIKFQSEVKRKLRLHHYGHSNAEWNAMALDYYRSAFTKVRPNYVPAVIRLPKRVMGVMGCFADAGEYKCSSNQYGAISVEAVNGKTLGIKPEEFEVIEWTTNPHKP